MKMKTAFFFFVILISVNACQNDETGTGTLVIKGVTAIPLQKSAMTDLSRSSQAMSSTHVMHTANLKVFIAELWVSQGLVTEDVYDDFDWYKIGENNELKLIEELLFTADNLPAGDYKSIKIAFKNTITRIAVYQSDINHTVEMQGSLNEENCGDETIITQYFSKRGNHSLGNDGKFRCDSRGETVRGFKVKPGGITTVYWKLGGPNSQLTDCTFDWVDVNDNQAWDCGVDYVGNFDCSVEGPMWTFGVDDGEEDLFIPNAVTDIDGNSYNAVKIGDQIWMQENLRTTRLNDGTYLMTREEYQQYLEDNPPAPPPTPMPQSPPMRAMQNNDTGLMAVYGYLYTYTAVATGKLSPAGWHVPSDEEWTILTDYLGNNAGGKLKSTELWQAPNQGATNETEFTALPGGGMILKTWTGPSGEVNSGYKYTGYGQFGYWLTSTDGWARILTYTSSEVSREYYHPTGAGGDESFLSCRCIKD